MILLVLADVQLDSCRNQKVALAIHLLLNQSNELDFQKKKPKFDSAEVDARYPKFGSSKEQS